MYHSYSKAIREMGKAQVARMEEKDRLGFKGWDTPNVDADYDIRARLFEKAKDIQDTCPECGVTSELVLEGLDLLEELVDIANLCMILWNVEVDKMLKEAKRGKDNAKPKGR